MSKTHLLSFWPEKSAMPIKSLMPNALNEINNMQMYQDNLMKTAFQIYLLFDIEFFINNFKSLIFLLTPYIIQF